MIYAGIDPGLEGAVAVIDTGDDPIDIDFHDTPTYQDGRRTRIDVGRCAGLIRTLQTAGLTHVTIEKVTSSPQMGVVSAWSFGMGFGVWLGILAALGVPHALVSPQTWKKAMMGGEPKEKGASRVVAARLYPLQTEESLSRKKDHNRADALLLAEYGRRLIAAPDVKRGRRAFQLEVASGNA